VEPTGHPVKRAAIEVSQHYDADLLVVGLYRADAVRLATKNQPTREKNRKQGAENDPIKPHGFLQFFKKTTPTKKPNQGLGFFAHEQGEAMGV
jgi:hypothetical protein